MHVHDWIALDHLDRMTDSTGLIQHAIYSIPRRESGYTTDDNARALRLCVSPVAASTRAERMLGRVTTYLSFLEHARCPVRGFHNFLSYQRDWLDAEGTGDCQGQAVRALAEVLGSNLPDGYRALARELIDAVLPALADLRSLRAQAYVILAWGHLRSRRVQDIEPLGTRRLVRGAAAGGMLPPLPAAGLAVVRVAHDLCQRGVAARPVRRRPALAGRGISRRGGSVVRLPRPRDDRRKTSSGRSETAIGIPTAKKRRCTISSRSRPSPWPTPRWPRSACGRRAKYLAAFRRAHDWFHGQNSLAEPLADVDSGACCDGLQPLGVNRNQGAESTLAYLWTVVHNREIQAMLANSPQSAVADAQFQASCLLQ